ncbi:hypothetical protein Microterr_10220 [Microbacterium terricola]|uniref:Uncharacterized protein n=1 Tax=Microbacterium terricola TaxID=344163 RepID=A0ABM8DXP0_9MICO|nr:hypothetical protein Microterr_10220 [Microbacterium terricola]
MVAAAERGWHGADRLGVQGHGREVDVGEAGLLGDALGDLHFGRKARQDQLLSQSGSFPDFCNDTSHILGADCPSAHEGFGESLHVNPFPAAILCRLGHECE